MSSGSRTALKPIYDAMRKMQASDRTEAAAIAMREGPGLKAPERNLHKSF